MAKKRQTPKTRTGKKLAVITPAPRMINLPDDTREKGLWRARLLFNGNFSKYVSFLIEQDYARDERMVMSVAPESPEYLAFREANPPIQLEPPAEQTESRKEDDG